MIEINLIKNHVPENVDIPEKLLKKRRIVHLSVILVTVVVSIIALFYLAKTFKNKITLKTTIPSKTNIAKTKEKTHVKNKEKIARKTKEVKEKTIPLKTPKNEETKQKAIPKINNQQVLKEIKKRAESEPIFTITLQFESIPEKKTVEQENAQLPPLPKVFLPKRKKKKTNKKSTSQFYVVKIRTNRPNEVSRILKKLGVNYSKKRIKTKVSSLYDVYVGGFYSYPQLVMFAKALKLKGYKIYSFKNINLLYYVCIDKGVDKKKMLAYKNVWGKTRFRVLFLKKNITKYVTIFTFTTTNSAIINSLKKRGLSPIIRRIKNGA